MRFDESVLDCSEKLIFSLRSLYGEYGYKRYKMSKFEEYALYGRNIDFLVSDSVITFTDTDGKLMALKPDVTLSIVKNDRDDAETVTKVCYDESVYRVSKGTGTFREIKQAGLECIGKVDAALVGETLMLAAKSLELSGKKFILEVSHLGLLDAALSLVTDDEGIKAKLFECVGGKNIHGIKEICRGAGIPEGKEDALVTLVATYGSVSEVAGKLAGSFAEDGIKELREVLSVFDGTPWADSVKVDFSVTADSNYYNGIIFKGFAEGVPEGVLSGGQYDRLMKKMGRRSKAVGFAVYLDVLERLLYGESFQRGEE